MGFSTILRSIGGLTTGEEFQAPSGLSDIEANTEPDVSDDNNMRLWAFGGWASQTYDPLSGFNSIGGVGVINTDLLDYLQNTTSSNRKVLMEFKIDDSSLADKVTLCLEAWISGGSYIVRPCRRVYDDDNPGVYVRTEYSSQRPEIATYQRIKLIAGEFHRNDGDLIGIGCMFCRDDNSQSQGEIFYANLESFKGLFGGGIPDGRKFSPNYGPASGFGGYGQAGGSKYGFSNLPGTFDNHSENVAMPAKPTYGVSSPGLLNLYVTTTGSLSKLGPALFPVPNISVDVAQAIDFLTAAIWNGKLIDYVIDAHVIPVTPQYGGLVDITCGGKKLVNPDNQQVYQAHPATEDFVDFDCGSISIDEYYRNFLDFSSVKSKLFLPFIGFVDVAPEYWAGGTLGLKYRFNIYDGSCVAFLFATSSKSQLTDGLIGQYCGSACIHIPLSGRDYSQVVAGAVKTASTLATGIAAPLASGAKDLGKTMSRASSLKPGNAKEGIAVTGALGVVGAGHAAEKVGESAQKHGTFGSMASAATQMIAAKPNFSLSNEYSGSASMMGCREPFLLIEYPIAQFSENYPHDIGIPLVVTDELGKFTGLTVCKNSHIHIAGATFKEKERIEAYLSSGVIL